MSMNMINNFLSIPLATNTFIDESEMRNPRKPSSSKKNFYLKGLRDDIIMKWNMISAFTAAVQARANHFILHQFQLVG